MSEELFEKKFLLRMGNKVVHAVKIDKTMMSVTQGRFARLCVQVDLQKPLIPFIELLENLQNGEYEGLHITCFECGGYNHRKENCSRRVRLLESVDKDTPQQVQEGEKSTPGTSPSK